MPDTNTNVMIALLPINSDWCRIELPHLTLVSAGEMKDLKPSALNALAKDAASIAMLARPLTLQVLGRDRFGQDDEAVDVLKLRKSTSLEAMRNFVESWNASQYPFNPHVTIGPPGTMIESIPSFIAFDRVMLAWGDDHITFLMQGSREYANA